MEHFVLSSPLSGEIEFFSFLHLSRGDSLFPELKFFNFIRLGSRQLQNSGTEARISTTEVRISNIPVTAPAEFHIPF
jgi:hypothetical protein